MLNLVVGVLATLTMILAAVAGLSYLGPAYGTAAAKAQVAQFVNGSSQILGAASLYRAENATTIADAAPGSAVDALVATSYLGSAPALPAAAAKGARWEVTIVDGAPVVSIDLDDASQATAEICALAATRGGGCAPDLSTLGQ